MLLGCYLCMAGAGDYAFDDNEHMHLSIAGGATFADVTRYSLYEVHPPLFYWLLHPWLMLSGDPFTIRLFPLAFGLALIRYGI